MKREVALEPRTFSTSPRGAGPPDQYYPTFSAAKAPLCKVKGAAIPRPRPILTPHHHGRQGPFFSLRAATGRVVSGRRGGANGKQS